MVIVGRARLVTHVFDDWGEKAAAEFSYEPSPPGFEPLLVFEFAPWRDRTWWTYATIGLSLCPAMDHHPPTELVAYSETQAEGLIDLMNQLAFKEETILYYRPGDIVSFPDDPPGLGVPLGRHYGLDLARESAELTTFPDVTRRPEDQRYVLARPGEDGTRIQFLRVVGLADVDRSRWESMRATIAATRAWRLF